MATGADWSDEEVLLTVADYFSMLADEIAGRPYSKAAHRRALGPRLEGRSEQSLEFKHCNISAVLVEMGLPYINGYKPRFNYQATLKTLVERFVSDNHPLVVALFDTETPTPEIVPLAAANIIEPPPEKIVAPSPTEKPWLTRKGKRVDFVARDAANKKLGQLGEQFILNFERRRLATLGRDDLAAKVEWVASTCGDGLGFDVLSFDEQTESEQFLEVKTTNLGKYFPFIVTSNEVRCSEDVPDRFRLVRLFDFSASPRLYVLPGAVTATCHLRPTQYLASRQ